MMEAFDVQVVLEKKKQILWEKHTYQDFDVRYVFGEFYRLSLIFSEFKNIFILFFGTNSEFKNIFNLFLYFIYIYQLKYWAISGLKMKGTVHYIGIEFWLIVTNSLLASWSLFYFSRRLESSRFHPISSRYSFDFLFLKRFCFFFFPELKFDHFVGWIFRSGTLNSSSNLGTEIRVLGENW